MKQKNRSRLARYRQSQTKKSLILTIGGIIVSVFVLLQFGLPMLANIALFLGGRDTEAVKKSEEFIASPVLDIPFTATNSAEISVKGNAPENTSVKVYRNGDLIEKIKTKKDGSFKLDSLTLEKGENEIKARTIDNKNNQSDFSDPIIITFANSEPKLTVDAPKNGDTISKDDKTVQVRGKTDSKNKVTVNDYWAIVDTDGNFTYDFSLKDGENILKITATDEAGNTKSEEVKITHSQ